MEMDLIRILVDVDHDVDGNLNVSPIISVPEQPFDINKLYDCFNKLKITIQDNNFIGKYCVVLKMVNGSYEMKNVFYPRSINMERIHNDVAMHFGLSPDDLLSKTKKRKIAKPRQFSMALMSYLLNSPTVVVGGFYGLDHATVIFARDKAIPAYYLSRDKEITDAISYFNTAYGLAKTINDHIKEILGKPVN
jgi:chromosomal replication initiation ATPase DnaA